MPKNKNWLEELNIYIKKITFTEIVNDFPCFIKIKDPIGLN